MKYIILLVVTSSLTIGACNNPNNPQQNSKDSANLGIGYGDTTRSPATNYSDSSNRAPSNNAGTTTDSSGSRGNVQGNSQSQP